jgi:hypothetical protein
VDEVERISSQLLGQTLCAAAKDDRMGFTAQKVTLRVWPPRCST